MPFFGVIADPQSYLNIFYLLFGLPLGIVYFVFLVTGISLGFGLLVVWVGVPILVLVLFGSWAMCQFERLLTIKLLKEAIPTMARKRQTEADRPGLSTDIDSEDQRQGRRSDGSRNAKVPRVSAEPRK